MNIYQHYKSINIKLAKDETLFFDEQKTRRLRYPKIGVYAGAGTSHSWLWFADMFDRMGFYDLVFLDENAVCEGLLNRLDVLAVSGGDTFAVARALGQKGAERIKAFVEAGGLYIGACAGAYLPMNSSKSPLNLFNFADVKITNLSKFLPKLLPEKGAKKMACKFCTAYGCDFIFHPVREEVTLRTNDLPPFAGTPLLKAPLYGGPGMIASRDSETLAYYHEFTEKTSFLVTRELARDTLIGNAAVVRVQRGEGCFYLFGPHFEHPHFPEANKLMADAVYWDIQEEPNTIGAKNDHAEILQKAGAKKLIREIKRDLSNSRIVAAGMELMPIQWLIGAKVYEPEKIRVFLEAMWKRIRTLEKCKELKLRPGMNERILRHAKETTRLLREIKNQLDENCDTETPAKALFDQLHKFSTAFLEIYFGNLRF